MFKLYGEKEKTAKEYCNSILKIENYLAESSLSSVELRDEIKNYHMFKLIYFFGNFPSLLFSLKALSNFG